MYNDQRVTIIEQREREKETHIQCVTYGIHCHGSR